MRAIGTLQENSLHAALKAWYSQPGDQTEVTVDSFIIDLVRGNHLFEVQTSNFSAIKRKLEKLLETHSIRLIYPISAEKWILRLAEDGKTVLGRRKSPKHGCLEDVFTELVYIPHLVAHPNFSLEVVLVNEEVIWREDGLGSWRRKGRSIADRRLLEVQGSFVFSYPGSYRALIPKSLPALFTIRDFARGSVKSYRVAQKFVYCLRKMGLIEQVGKRGRCNEFKLT